MPRPPIVVRRGSARSFELASLDFRIFGKAKAPPALLLFIQRSSRLSVRSAPCRRAYSGSLTAVTLRSTHDDRLKQMTVAHGPRAEPQTADQLPGARSAAGTAPALGHPLGLAGALFHAGQAVASHMKRHCLLALEGRRSLIRTKHAPALACGRALGALDLPAFLPPGPSLTLNFLGLIRCPVATGCSGSPRTGTPVQTEAVSSAHRIRQRSPGT